MHQPPDRLGDLVRRLHRLERVLGDQRGAHGLVAFAPHPVDQPVALDETGQQRIDADLGRQHPRERERHGVERALGRGIGHAGPRAAQPADRGHVDDRGIAGPPQQGGHGPRDDIDARDVDGEHALEVVERQAVQVLVVI